MGANIRRGGWGAWALLVLVILVLAAPVITYPLGRDQGEFAVIASGILRGAVPYVDLWNPKPPAIFYTYAAAIRAFGHSVMALRALDLLLFPLMAAGLYAIGRRLDGAALGLWAVLFYGVFYFTETFWTLTQNDGIAAVPMALAVWCVFVLVDADRARPGIAFACGMLAALVLWFKYPFVFFVLALMIGYVQGRGRIVWGEVAAFVAGGLLIGLGGMAYLWKQGALGAWLTSAQVTAGYTAQGYDFATFRADMTNYIGYRWQHWHVIWVLLTVFVAVMGAQIAQKTRKLSNPLVTDGRGWRIIGVWLLGTVVSMLIQAKGYDYHWLPMLPPLSLIAGRTLHWLQSVFSFPRLTQITISLALLVWLALHTWGVALPYLTGQETRTDYAARFVGNEFVADESAAVAAYLRERVAPNDTLYIWGFRPEIYYMSHLRPATRFIFQFPLVADWYPAAWQQENVDTLWASLPPYVLVLQGDFMPWVTGRDADSNMLLQEYTELNNWLIYNYERDTQIGNVLIWQRKP